MNNTLDRLIEGTISSIESNLLPHIHDEFARGQAFGIIYVLRCIGKRAAWSEGYVDERFEAAFATLLELQAILLPLRSIPEIGNELDTPIDKRTAPEESIARMMGQICDLYDWTEANREKLPPAVVSKVRDITNRYLTVQLKTELKRDVRLNFAEMSTGEKIKQEHR